MIRLRTLGSVELRDDAGRELRVVLAQPKRLALLVGLAVARPAGVHRRDLLLALLWPELSEVRARDALNQALRFLRQEIGQDAFVRRGADEIGVNPERLWCDAVAFREALDEGRPAEALDLYRGAFLQGFFVEADGGFDAWVESERAALRERAAAGARLLAGQHEDAGTLTLAIQWGRRALELAPDDERAVRRLLTLYDRAGDRAGALHVYDAFARRLRTEYECDPSPETAALAERVRTAVQPSPSRAVRQPRVGPRLPEAAAVTDGGDFGGRYRIEGELGTGGMASVYLARDLKHDRDVALKMLRPEIADEISQDRFEREIRIAARLQHPNIVPLFDSGNAEGRIYYVMPHVHGETLRARLDRQGALSIADTLHVLREISDALAHAHDQGVIHRDVKPENVLLTQGRAVIADFGIARAAHAAHAPARGQQITHTQLGISLGTPAYMAPEQAAGSREIDHRADLYALGAVAYELLAGRPPFVKASPEQLLAAHLVERPLPVTALRADTPAALGAIVMQCLEKDAARRPTSAAEISAALENLSLGARNAGRGRRSAFATGLVATGVVTALVGAFLGSRAIGVGRSPADTRPIASTGSVLVTDFGSSPEDSTLARMSAEAVRIGLEQSDVIRVLSPETVADAMRRTRREPTERVTPRLARELAAREGVGVIADGDLLRSGRGFLLTVRLVAADSGTPLATRSATAEDPARLLAAADYITRELRSRLGETLANVRASAPLERVTTSSLEALKLYTQARRAHVLDADIPKATALLRQAVAMDTQFAIAWRALYMTGREPEAITRAYRHRDRATEIERLNIEGTYFAAGANPAADLGKSIAAYEELAAREGFPSNNLAWGLLFRRDFARAESLYRIILARETETVIPYQGFFLSLMNQGKGAQADSVARAARERFLDAPWIRLWVAELDCGQRRYDACEAALDSMAAGQNGDRARNSLANLLLMRGELRRSERMRRPRGQTRNARPARTPNVDATLRAVMIDTWLTRDHARARARLDSLADGVGRESLLPIARAYAMLGQSARGRALLARWERQVPDSVRRDHERSEQRRVLAELAIADGRPMDGMEHYRAADRRPDGSPWPCPKCLPLALARAYDAANQSDSAALWWERFVSTPQYYPGYWPARETEIPALAHAYERLGALHEALGNRHNAREYYGRFVELWRDADPQLQRRVVAAQQRLVQLARDSR